jgi:hypothetical protein
LAAIYFEPVCNRSAKPGKATPPATAVFTTPDNPSCLPGGQRAISKSGTGFASDRALRS